MMRRGEALLIVAAIVGQKEVILEGCKQRFCIAVGSWSQALVLLSSPASLPQSLSQLSKMVDDIWHVCGDASADFSWYTKRAALAGSRPLHLPRSYSLLLCRPSSYTARDQSMFTEDAIRSTDLTLDRTRAVLTIF